MKKPLLTSLSKPPRGGELRWFGMYRHRGMFIHQTPFLVKGFRLFDKVKCKGRIGFIFGRRSFGYFDVRTLDGVRLSACVSFKKLMLVEKRTTFLTQLRKECGASSPS